MTMTDEVEVPAQLTGPVLDLEVVSEAFCGPVRRTLNALRGLGLDARLASKECDRKTSGLAEWYKQDERLE